MNKLLFARPRIHSLRRFMRTASMIAMLVLLFNLFGGTRGAAASLPATCAGVNPTMCAGAIGGAAYLVEVPSNWKGDVVLYSHGYVAPGSANPARDVGDPGTRAFLLAQGFALAGSAYSTTGWAVQQALSDQIALLDWFTANFGHPQKTIAWGHSLGGLITAGLIQKHPGRFDAALPMCGAVAGGVGVWNQELDSAFAFKTLLAPGTSLQIVNITNPALNFTTAEGILAGAQTTPQGRARIALVSAFGDIPGWFDPASPEPASNDYASREANQFLWAQQVDFPFAFALRAELEARAGGNPSWNTGVDYHEQLAKSVDRDEVGALYQQAGLSLDQDLNTLENTARISANQSAVRYLARNITLDHKLHIPVLTMHTTGDGLVTVQNEQAYASAVGDDDRGLLREVFVHRAGHCAFTPAETVTAFQALVARMNTGHWPTLNPADLNAEAALLGPLNIAPPAFLPYQPSVFMRPSDN
jgi:pimeloyl-ACP methyl ester carboxylesterase